MLPIFSIAFLLALVATWLCFSHNQAYKDTSGDIVRHVDDVLPQTQCRRCGYDGCRPYAEAVVYSRESIALCQPGGLATRTKLGEMLGRDSGTVTGVARDEAAVTAVIVEADCIGCTKCIQACPVDAIVGASARMHTVVTALCTGCALCTPVCPTDCIKLHQRSEPIPGIIES